MTTIELLHTCHTIIMSQVYSIRSSSQRLGVFLSLNFFFEITYTVCSEHTGVYLVSQYSCRA